MLCPVLIGRDDDVRRLEQHLDALPDGGGVVALVGDAGSGKSSLIAHITGTSSGRGVEVLAGRAVPGESPVPYRPLIEALLSGLRGRPRPEDPALAGFEGHLGRLVPMWPTEASVDDSPMLLAEAVVRLLSVLARDHGCVLVLEDLHWADPETLDVVAYLMDALAREPVLCIVTTRPTGPAMDLVDRLERDPGAVLRVEPLDGDGVGQMVAACLEETHPPNGLEPFLHTHSDGNPFLIEELLAGLVATGTLRHATNGWEIQGRLTPAVPARLADSVRSRLATLDPTARRILGAAALLGRSFEWDLLPGIAEVDGPTIVAALRAGVDEQLLEPDGDGFTFRHALTREAVLSDLLPPERRELASRAWPSIERANPGLPGATCQLAADLAEAAGDRAAAVERLIEGAQRALATGAFATAESIAGRARDLASDDDTLVLETDEVLLHVLAAAGRTDEALTLGHDLDRRLAASEHVAPTRRVDVLVAIAQAAVAAGDLDAASGAVSRAQQVDGGDPRLLARRDALAAEVALDRAELEEAEALACQAIDDARATDQPAVECEALLILGRVQRPRGAAEAVASFEAAAEVAIRSSLPRWHLRAEQELSLHAAYGHERPGERRLPGGVDTLRRTRDLAARYGAHITVAVMDLGLADVALGNFDAVGCQEASTACIEASRRYGLVHEPVAQLWLAGANALGGDEQAMQAALDAALSHDPDDPRILADLYGRVMASRAFVRDELDELPSIVDLMMEHVRCAPTTMSVYPGRILWALLHVADDEDGGLAALTEYHETAGAVGMDLFRLFGDVLDAVALGRAGRVDEATKSVAPAYDALTTAVVGQGMVRCGAIVLARIATRDRWGDPVRWLRESEAWFAERNYDRIVRRCRALLGEAGAPVPRRGRGDSEVPTDLRAMGVTSREVDVLKLVVAGKTNKEIAAALYLSPKTVERHLTSLFNRTGADDRHELAELGVRHLP